ALVAAGVEEPVPQKLELDMKHPAVVEDRTQLLQAAILEKVKEVGVPQPEAAEAGARRRRDPVRDVEQTPLAPGVQFHRAGQRPVRGEQVDIHAGCPDIAAAASARCRKRGNHVVSTPPAANSGSPVSARYMGTVVVTPSTAKRARALRSRSSASARSRPDAISFATRES